MKDFLAHYIPKNAGKVLDEAGKTIGSHDGATFFTLGQRHGFMVTEKTIADKPLYVFAKDVEANIITVSQRDVEASPLTTSTVIIGSISWTGQAVKNGAECAARIRYRQPLERCTITAISGKSAQYQLHFAAPQFAAAAGQSVVLYQNGVCVGGGIIEKGV